MLKTNKQTIKKLILLAGVCVFLLAKGAVKAQTVPFLPNAVDWVSGTSLSDCHGLRCGDGISRTYIKPLTVEEIRNMTRNPSFQRFESYTDASGATKYRYKAVYHWYTGQYLAWVCDMKIRYVSYTCACPSGNGEVLPDGGGIGRTCMTDCRYPDGTPVVDPYNPPADKVQEKIMTYRSAALTTLVRDNIPDACGSYSSAIILQSVEGLGNCVRNCHKGGPPWTLFLTNNDCVSIPTPTTPPPPTVTPTNTPAIPTSTPTRVPTATPTYQPPTYAPSKTPTPTPTRAVPSLTPTKPPTGNKKLVGVQVRTVLNSPTVTLGLGIPSIIKPYLKHLTLRQIYPNYQTNPAIISESTTQVKLNLTVGKLYRYELCAVMENGRKYCDTFISSPTGTQGPYSPIVFTVGRSPFDRAYGLWVYYP